MLGNFNACWEFTSQAEGGFTSDPADPGNWTSGVCGQGQCLGTNYGISASSYPNLDIANLTLEQAGAIYKSDYWDKVNGDSLPVGVDLMVFDAAVNIGPGTAAKMLQGLVGATQDGQIGQKTLAAIGNSTPSILVARLRNARLQYYQSLPQFSTFGTGWTNRTNACQAAALAMITQPF